MNNHPKYFTKKTIRDVPIHNKRILLRADYNVPLTDEQEIASDYRITQSLPTLEYLLERNCFVVIVAHLGRPEGKHDKKLSLGPIAQYLKKVLPKYQVTFVPSTVDDKARQACKVAEGGKVVLLENLRFDPREEEDSVEFAQSLQKVAQPDYFVQDGFGVVHRAHASTSAVTKLVPSVAGLLLAKEVTVLKKAMNHPEHPLVAVVGGAKISDKIGFMQKLLPLSDTLLVGGAMANTFLKTQGAPIGQSIFEAGQEGAVQQLLASAVQNQVVLPTDVAVANAIEESAERRECSITGVRESESILDIGEKTMKQFDEIISSAATVIWNGTLGYAELPRFALGSAHMAQSMTEKNRNIVSIVGGGDTAEFALEWFKKNPEARFTHISTGGGASLELMSGLKLPGVEALIDA